MTATCDDGSGQVRERVNLLQLTRPGDGQEAFDGTFTVRAARAEHDFAPLNGGPERALGGIVSRLDALLVHEGEEVKVVHEESGCQVPDVFVRCVEIPLPQREEPLLDRQDLVDQLRARERGATRVRIASEAMPEPKQAAIKCERRAAEPLRGGRGRQVERTEYVPSDVGPAELTLTGHIFEVRGQAVACENPGERRSEDGLQDVRAAGGRNAIDHKQARDERPEPALVSVGAVARFINVEDGFVTQRRGEFGVRRCDGGTRFSRANSNSRP